METSALATTFMNYVDFVHDHCVLSKIADDPPDHRPSFFFCRILAFDAFGLELIYYKIRTHALIKLVRTRYKENTSTSPSAPFNSREAIQQAIWKTMREVAGMNEEELQLLRRIFMLHVWRLFILVPQQLQGRL